LYVDGDGHSQAAFDQAIEQLEALGGERVTIDYEPLEKLLRCCMKARWWLSATRPLRTF